MTVNASLSGLEAARAKTRKKRWATSPFLVIGILLIVLSMVALFSLSGKAVRYDQAYDQGKELGDYFFGTLAEGETYSPMQNLWFSIARHRVWPVVAGIFFIALFIFFNRELLYSQKIAPYVFVFPFVLIFLVFFLSPFITTVQMSFQSIKSSSREWIGWKNYTDMFRNKNFYVAVKNSLVYMGLTCALLVPLPLLFAYMLESKSMKYSGFFKAIYYMPVLCSVVVAGIIFRMMFSELPGSLMNQARGLFGLEAIPWMKHSAGTAMFAMVLLCCWRWTGMNILYYMAGIKSIPGDLYEAADIDGANAAQKFLHVGLPLLKPTAIYVLTISIYAGLSMFTESLMIFGTNNSPKNYGLTIVGYLYRYGFEKVDKMGFASAVGLVLLAGAMVITIAQLIATGTISVGKRKEG